MCVSNVQTYMSLTLLNYFPKTILQDKGEWYVTWCLSAKQLQLSRARVCFFDISNGISASNNILFCIWNYNSRSPSHGQSACVLASHWPARVTWPQHSALIDHLVAILLNISLILQLYEKYSDRYWVFKLLLTTFWTGQPSSMTNDQTQQIWKQGTFFPLEKT